MADVFDVEAELKKLVFMEGRTPHTPLEEEDKTFKNLGLYRGGEMYVGGFSGQSPWERHPGGDEFATRTQRSAFCFDEVAIRNLATVEIIERRTTVVDDEIVDIEPEVPAIETAHGPEYLELGTGGFQFDARGSYDAIRIDETAHFDDVVDTESIDRRRADAVVERGLERNLHDLAKHDDPAHRDVDTLDRTLDVIVECHVVGTAVNTVVVYRAADRDDLADLEIVLRSGFAIDRERRTRCFVANAVDDDAAERRDRTHRDASSADAADGGRIRRWRRGAIATSAATTAGRCEHENKCVKNQVGNFHGYIPFGNCPVIA